jgi:hypothetical protein
VIRRSEPPLGRWGILHGEGWWGSAWFVVKGDPPKSVDDEPRANKPAFASAVQRYLDSLPGEPAQFGAARWGSEDFCELPVEGWTDFAVDAGILMYAEGEAKITEWRACSSDDPNVPVFLVGLRGDGEAAACVAPRKVSP